MNITKNNLIKKIFVPAMFVMVIILFSSAAAYADTGMAESFEITGKAVAAGIAVGLAAIGGTLAMGMAISKSAEGIARQPEAEGKIRTTLMLGLVFIETVVIYALIVAILIFFVL